MNHIKGEFSHHWHSNPKLLKPACTHLICCFWQEHGILYLKYVGWGRVYRRAQLKFQFLFTMLYLNTQHFSFNTQFLMHEAEHFIPCAFLGMLGMWQSEFSLKAPSTSCGISWSRFPDVDLAHGGRKLLPHRGCLPGLTYSLLPQCLCSTFLSFFFLF